MNNIEKLAQPNLKFSYDQLTEEFICDLDDKTVLIISGGNRGIWAQHFNAQKPTETVTISKAEHDALVKDAERLKALCKEFDEWQPDKPRPSYLKVMPIWGAMCEAIGDGADGNALRQDIDSAKGK